MRQDGNRRAKRHSLVYGRRAVFGLGMGLVQG